MQPSMSGLLVTCRRTQVARQKVDRAAMPVLCGAVIGTDSATSTAPDQASKLTLENEIEIDWTESKNSALPELWRPVHTWPI